jgi:hypothetical protein
MHDVDDNVEALRMVLKGLVVTSQSLHITDEQADALVKQWATDQPDDPVEFEFNMVLI